MSRSPAIPQTRPPMRRMLFIHEKLKSGSFPNCHKLRVELEVGCTRTILRDVEFMRDQLRLPIDYDRQRHGFYYTRPVEHFPGVVVSEAELFALLVAQKALVHYQGTAFYQPLRTAFEKLSAGLDPEVVVHLESLGEAMDIRVSGLEDVNEETFQVVVRAIQQTRPLQFRYRKHAAKGVESRSLNPYQLVCANNRWYVLGRDLRRDAVRAFVLSRMTNPRILDGVFKRPGDFRIADHLKGSFGIFKGHEDFEVVIDLDRWAADVMRDRRWHASQQVTELPGGELRIAFRLDNLEEIEPWVLSWGGHAVVVRPKALADRVTAAAGAVLKRYSRGSRPRKSAVQRDLSLGIA
ncbi:MAG: helix-turn-helix transcriptional regulator [Limisphaerales bacterium]